MYSMSTQQSKSQAEKVCGNLRLGEIGQLALPSSTFRMERDAAPRNRTLSVDTPRSRSSGSDLLQKEMWRRRRWDISGWKRVKDRTRLRSNPNSHRDRGRLACNRAVCTHGRIELLPSLPLASHAASKRGANRKAEKIVVWMSSATFFSVTMRQMQRCASSKHSGTTPASPG